MGFLIDIINERERAKYEQNALKLQNNVVEPITKREYLVPNNAKSSATYFWQNVLLIPPAADGHTFPLTFIPSDSQDIIVRARFSNHPSGPLENWTKYEAMGSPNKRVDIYFFNANDVDNPNGDVEAHIISNKHLYSDSDVKLLQQALANFFKSGNFINPFCAESSYEQQGTGTIQNNQELNTEQYMKKKLIRLTESDLKRIVRESIVNTLEKDLNGNAIYDLGNGYTTSDLRGMERSLKEKLSYLYDMKGRLLKQIDEIESDIQDFEERLTEVEELLYGNEQ